MNKTKPYWILLALYWILLALFFGLLAFSVLTLMDTHWQRKSLVLIGGGLFFFGLAVLPVFLLNRSSWATLQGKLYLVFSIAIIIGVIVAGIRIATVVIPDVRRIKAENYGMARLNLQRKKIEALDANQKNELAIKMVAVILASESKPENRVEAANYLTYIGKPAIPVIMNGLDQKRALQADKRSLKFLGMLLDAIKNGKQWFLSTPPSAARAGAR